VDQPGGCFVDYMEDSSANLKVQLMQLSNELRLLNEENLNLKKRLSAVWEEKQACEQILSQKEVEIQKLESAHEHVKEKTRADHVLAQSQELIGLQQILNEQTHFLEKLSNSVIRLLVTAHSIQTLPQQVTQILNEMEDLCWTDGLAEQKLTIALIRSGSRLPRSELQAKCKLSSKDFERALNLLQRSRILTEKGPDRIELTIATSVSIPSNQWGKLNPPEIFQQIREVVMLEEDVSLITKALMDLRNTLFIKGVPPRVGYQIEAGAREWRSGRITKQDLLNALSEWEAQALG